MNGRVLIAAGFLLAALANAAVSLPAQAQEKPPAAKASPARQAMIARMHACAAEWKADKAAGKVAAGTKWPQYWSACNKRKKAEGM